MCTVERSERSLARGRLRILKLKVVYIFLCSSPTAATAREVPDRPWGLRTAGTQLAARVTAMAAAAAAAVVVAVGTRGALACSSNDSVPIPLLLGPGLPDSSNRRRQVRSDGGRIGEGQHIGHVPSILRSDMGGRERSGQGMGDRHLVRDAIPVAKQYKVIGESLYWPIPKTPLGGYR